MAQDFAKQRANPDLGKRKRAVSKGPPQGNANWSWFFSGLMTGVIVSIAAYLGVVKLDEGLTADAQLVETGVNPEDQPTYNFYEVLTNAEIPVNVSDARGTAAAGNDARPAAEGATNPVVATTQNVASVAEERPDLYLLQAGSFQTQQDAESRRARVILLNMNSNVVEGIVGGRTRYRVQVGPFAGRQNAEDARDLLSANDIESIFTKVSPPP